MCLETNFRRETQDNQRETIGQGDSWAPNKESREMEETECKYSETGLDLDRSSIIKGLGS